MPPKKDITNHSLHIQTVGQTLSCCWRVLNTEVEQGISSTAIKFNSWDKEQGPEPHHQEIKTPGFPLIFWFWICNTRGFQWTVRVLETQQPKSQLSIVPLSHSWTFPMASALPTHSLRAHPVQLTPCPSHPSAFRDPGSSSSQRFSWCAQIQTGLTARSCGHNAVVKDKALEPWGKSVP